MKIIHINNKPYAVGLWWQLHQGKSTRRALLQSARNTAKELEKTANYSAVAVTPRQYGLGLGDYEKNTLALAGSIRPNVQTSQGFIGVFAFASGFWVCAISNMIIAAEGDQFFSTAEEAFAHAQNLADLFGDKEEISCASQEESEHYLAPLLFNNGAIVEPLTQSIISNIRVLQLLGSIAVVFIISCAGYYVWDLMESKAAQERVMTLLQNKEAREERALTSIQRYFPNVWETAPSVQAMHTQCMDALLPIPAFSKGWKRTSAKCTATQVSIAWVHQKEASFVDLPPFAELSKNRLQSVSNLSLPSIAPRKNNASLRTQKEIATLFYELTRLVQCNLSTFSWKQRGTRNVDGTQIVAPFIEGTWKLTNIPATYSEVVFNYLEQLETSGLIIHEISYDSTWSIKGAIYAK